jgi:hypothetical protein
MFDVGSICSAKSLKVTPSVFFFILMAASADLGRPHVHAGVAALHDPARNRVPDILEGD